MTALNLRIVGHTLPGLRFHECEPVYLGVQRGSDVVYLTPGDAGEAVFEMTVEAVRRDDGDLDFRGPFVHGKRGDRFLYLSWGVLGPDGRFAMFRRAKLRFSDIAAPDIDRALATGDTLAGALSLTGDRGGPLCAAVRPPRIRWRVASAPPA